MCSWFLRSTRRCFHPKEREASRARPTASHYPLQQLGVLGGDDGLAAADADVSEDPQVDASRQGDGQAQQQEAEQHAGRGVKGVLAGRVGCEQKKGRHKDEASFTTETENVPMSHDLNPVLPSMI